MRPLALLCLLLLSFSAFSASSDTSDLRRFKYFDCLDIDVGKVYPFSKEFGHSAFKNYLSFGFGLNFLNFSVTDNISFSQQIGATFSGKNYKNIIEDITFQDGYHGGFHADAYRTSLFVGTTLRYKLGKNVALGLPINYVMRWWGYNGRFYLNEGQAIDPQDVVTGHEANASNKFKIYNDFAHGFNTGLELVLFGDSRFSLYTRLTINFFPGISVYDLENSALEGGELTIPNEAVQNGTDVRFVFGIRSYVFRVEKGSTKHKGTDPDVILTPDKRKK